MKAVLPILLAAAILTHAAKVGYRRVENAAGIAHLWYPTDSREEPESRRYLPLPVTKAISVVEGAEPAPGSRPLILLSHGILGLATSYSWLAHRLAAAGAVVLSPEHKGQSRADLEEPELFRFHRRPATLSAQLDWILADKGFAGILDTSRVHIVGHSVGGHSALLLAGARYDLDAVLERGRSQSQRDRLAARMAKAQAEAPPASADWDANGRDYRDPRIRRAVLLDPVPVHPGFTDSSLRALAVPILYVGCSRSEIFDSDAVKAALAGLIPRFQSRETGAGHFVFADEGTWLGRLVRPSVFKDPVGIERARMHEQVHAWISVFLELGDDPPTVAREGDAP